MDRPSQNIDDFAKSWRDALASAEIQPSDRTWSAIRGRMDAFFISRYQLKNTIYKWTAVIAVIVSISVSLPSQWRDYLGADQLSWSSIINFSKDSKNNDFRAVLIDDDFGFKDTPLVVQSIGSEQTSKSVITEISALENRLDNSSKMILSDFLVKKDLEEVAAIDLDKEMEIIPNFNFVIFNTNIIDKSTTRLWAGINVGGSTYDPNFQMNQSSLPGTGISMNPEFMNGLGGSVASLNETMTAGVTRKIEFNLGMVVKNRFTIEGGVQYSQAELIQHSNLLIQEFYFPTSMPIGSNQFSDISNQNKSKSSANQSQYISYSEENLAFQNKIDFATIPIRAGYLIIDQKLTVRVNAGVVTNFYLGNVKTDVLDDQTFYSYESGDNIIYKDISFSGQTGFSLGYRVLEKVDFTLEPNYTQSFQSITRDFSNFSASPNGFGVMAGVRYNFK
jgi:hypothetical protein